MPSNYPVRSPIGQSHEHARVAEQLAISAWLYDSPALYPDVGTACRAAERTA
jgi:hypothetical protein